MVSSDAQSDPSNGPVTGGLGPLESKMLAALEQCLGALDELMGDTDPYDETPALLACQAASAAIASAVKQ